MTVEFLPFSTPRSMEHTCLTRKAGGESGSPRYSPPEIFLPQAAMTEKVQPRPAGACQGKGF